MPTLELILSQLWTSGSSHALPLIPMVQDKLILTDTAIESIQNGAAKLQDLLKARTGEIYTDLERAIILYLEQSVESLTEDIVFHTIEKFLL